jgi:glycosyltransferase involved in cell wall biosynthesis
MQNTKIVVPCYDEAGRLQPEPFLAACAEQPCLSFVFVDDGSKDDTFAILQELAKRAPNQITALRLPANAGKAEAVRRGVLHALATPAELVGFWDADLATPLYNIARLAQVLERPAIQLVMGSRVRLLGHQIKRVGARHYLGRVFATLAALSLRLPVYDTQCGAKLFRANDTFRALFSRPFELNWSFDVELLARFVHATRRAGHDPQERVVEVALDAWEDVAGSKLRPSHYPRIAWEAAKLIVIARAG